MQITITESGNQLNSNNLSITVQKSSVSGSNLPGVTYQNNTSLSLNLSFTTSPFTESSYEISGNGSVTPTWKTTVTAQEYDFQAGHGRSAHEREHHDLRRRQVTVTRRAAFGTESSRRCGR